MKKFKLSFLILAVGLFLITGCGKDGLDGKATLKFDWDWYVDTYWDSNPGVPTTISKMVPYNTQPGTFTYEYDCSDAYDS
ncbi:MAG: hypothetical protein KGZ97_08615 [Bacteroidetes bacterium]|nr:hypothetical protein [Bacteroidota bacterium]